MLIIPLPIVLTYLSAGLLMYWLPLLAAMYFKPPPVELHRPRKTSRIPQLYIVGSCHNASSSISELVHCLREQNYPQNNYRILILVDNCTDNSADIARSLGVDVYERHDTEKMGKGYALNELLEQRLRGESFDILILFDIDARVDPQFLERAADHFCQGAIALQGATLSKNPNETILARVGDIIQSVIRLHQRGRSLLGWRPLVIGSHGIALNRDSLARLGWRINTGRTGDDIELGIRCYLCDVPVTYASDLMVSNDLPSDAGAVRRQRRRWTASSLRLTPRYLVPLLRRAFRGDGGALDVLGILILPSFSNLFLLLTFTVAFLTVAQQLWHAPASLYLWIAVFLWISDVLYFMAAFRTEGCVLRWKDLWGFATFLPVRAVALLEGFMLVRSKDWWPTSHRENPSNLPSKPKINQSLKG